MVSEQQCRDLVAAKAKSHVADHCEECGQQSHSLETVLGADVQLCPECQEKQ